MSFWCCPSQRSGQPYSRIPLLSGHAPPPFTGLSLRGQTMGASDATRAVNAGLRFWLQPEVLGLDLVGSRSRAADQRLGTGVNIGLGWYGLRLF